MSQTTSLLRIDRVIERRGRSRAQLYVDIRRGVMPPPVHIGDAGKLSVWPSHEIDRLIRAEVAGASQDELRALVRQFLEERKPSRPTLPAAPQRTEGAAA